MIKNLFNGFSRGFGYTTGKLIVYLLVGCFLANLLKGCDFDEVQNVFDAIFVI